MQSPSSVRGQGGPRGTGPRQPHHPHSSWHPIAGTGSTPAIRGLWPDLATGSRPTPPPPPCPLPCMQPAREAAGAAGLGSNPPSSPHPFGQHEARAAAQSRAPWGWRAARRPEPPSQPLSPTPRPPPRLTEAAEGLAAAERRESHVYPHASSSRHRAAPGRAGARAGASASVSLSASAAPSARAAARHAPAGDSSPFAGPSPTAASCTDAFCERTVASS